MQKKKRYEVSNEIKLLVGKGQVEGFKKHFSSFTSHFMLCSFDIKIVTIILEKMIAEGKPHIRVSMHCWWNCAFLEVELELGFGEMLIRTFNFGEKM